MSNFFEGDDFQDEPFKALLPQYYPTEYQKYIQEEEAVISQAIGQSQIVLEGGVGLGRLIPLIAPKVEELHGVDQAGLMVEQAKQKAKDFPNTYIHKINLEKLGSHFSSGFFDVSCCVWNTLGNVKDEVVVLTELKKVTTKKIIVSVHAKGAFENRLRWYEHFHIRPLKIDEQEEVFYSESGLVSKAYGVEDLVRLGDSVGLKFTNAKLLNGLVWYGEFTN